MGLPIWFVGDFVRQYGVLLLGRGNGTVSRSRPLFTMRPRPQVVADFNGDRAVPDNPCRQFHSVVAAGGVQAAASFGMKTLLEATPQFARRGQGHSRSPCKSTLTGLIRTGL